MNAEAQTWLRYARENHEVAKLALERGLFNACVQNTHQAVEKSLKAALLVIGRPVKRTHSILGLHTELAGNGIETGLTVENCDLLDSLYLPSKYPLGAALPDFEPDLELAAECLGIAGKVMAMVGEKMGAA